MYNQTSRFQQSAWRGLLISLFAILGIGFVLGIRHATDPDHVIAVSTIVTREQKLSRAAGIGIAWGIGHTITIFVVGSILILFRVTLPPRLGLSMELAVGLMLIFLGLRNLRATFFLPAKRNSRSHPHYHAHGDYIHAHDDAHKHASEPTPVSRLDRLFGGVPFYRSFRPLAIGIVHGLAGSAAIALLVLSTIQQPGWALAYLVIFGVGTVLGMVVITLAMVSTLSFGQKRFTRVGQHFGVAAGLISLMFGIFVTYQIGFSAGLFTGHPVWIPR